MTEVENRQIEDCLKRLMNYYNSGCDWYGFIPLLKVMWGKHFSIPITEQILKSEEWKNMYKYWHEIVEHDKKSLLSQLNETEAEVFFRKLLILFLIKENKQFRLSI